MTTTVKLDTTGVGEGSGSQSRAQVEYADSENLPDVLSQLADRTQLTRATLAHVLIESGRVDQFKANPQRFIDQATAVLSTAKVKLPVDGVRYTPVPAGRPDAERWYSQEMFAEEDLARYIGDGGDIFTDEHGEPKHFSKSIFESLVTDSAVERAFAEQLQKQSEVKLFVKLPSAFKVPTPLGSYNPDCAAIVERDGLDTLYLVVETKGTNDKSKLREAERQDIDSATRHFEAIRVANGFVDLIYPDHLVVTIEDVESYLDAMPVGIESTS